MSNKVKSPLMKKAPTYSLRASIISILIGLLTGAVVILIVGAFNPLISLKGAWDGIRLVLFGVLSTGRDAAGALTFGFNPTNIGNMLFRATPLILTGVSVAVAFKTGLFNIGAPGQYLAGTTASLFLALSIPSSSVPAWLIWFIAFLGGVLAGALWGAIPGLLKATLNINEVIACIMTNWIAASLVTWLFDISNLKNIVEGNKTGYVYKTTYNGVATSKMGLDKLFPGSQVNGGIIIAIIMAILVYIMLEKTTFGYELKACGANRHAARYAGIHDRRNIVCSMAIAGAMAGAAGALYYLSGNTEFFWTTYQSLPSEGFDGIAVALLAVNNPIGVIFTGIFMSLLSIAGLQLTNLTAYNEYITDVIIAVIVYLSAFSLVIKLWISRRKKEGKSILPWKKKQPEGAGLLPDAQPAEEAAAAAELAESRRRLWRKPRLLLTLIYAIPLMVVALAGIFAERSGIINLALEGIMIFGAFIGVLFVRMMQAMGWFEAAKAADNWVALQGYLLLAMLVAAILGAVFSLLLAFAAINLRADQTIGGTALNMLAPALVLFLVRLIAKQNQLLLLKGDSASWFMIKKTMLGFDRTAELNFFQETFLNKVYLSNYVCVLVFIILAIILYKTRFGLRLRACGENPQAADSLGINVYKMRYAGTTISGALAGMGGFVYAVTTANCSANGDVAGFGFLALAVMIFGNWKPLNVAGGALLFGLFKCIAACYSTLDINGDGIYALTELGLNANFYRLLPYVITLVVLAFTSKSSRAPKAEGIPYDKGQR